MNPETSTPNDWQSRFAESFQEVLHKLIEYAPRIIGAIALLLAGLVVAYILKLISQKTIEGLNVLLARISKSNIRIHLSYTKTIGNVLFWMVFSLFLAGSADLLGWTLLTEWLDSVVAFLPNLVSGLLIVFIGIVVGNLARSGIATAATRSSIGNAILLGRIAHAIIIFSFTVIGIEQIGINLHFLTEVSVVILAILMAGAALAFGLGAKSLVANIIGIQRIRHHCNVGERLSIKGYEGEIVELTQTSIIIDSADGRIIIPAKLFQDEVTQIKNSPEPAESSVENKGGDK